jgi:flagellar FliL protein
MAKKPKKDDAEEGAPEGEGAEGAPAQKGGGKKKLILIVAAVLLLAGGGGGGYWFFVKRNAAAAGEGHEAAGPPKKTAFVDLKEMMVNLAGQNTQQTGERARYLKLRVSLEVGDPHLVAEVQPLLPRIEDSFQVYMRELRMNDLEGSAGVYRLKEELLRRVNVAVYPAKVDAILFKEILIQ